MHGLLQSLAITFLKMRIFGKAPYWASAALSQARISSNRFTSSVLNHPSTCGTVHSFELLAKSSTSSSLNYPSACGIVQTLKSAILRPRFPHPTLQRILLSFFSQARIQSKPSTSSVLNYPSTSSTVHSFWTPTFRDPISALPSPYTQETYLYLFLSSTYPIKIVHVFRSQPSIYLRYSSQLLDSNFSHHFRALHTPLYEIKTVLRDSPSLKSVILNLPTAEIPRPRAPTKCPQTPIPTMLTVFFPFPTTSTPLHQNGVHRSTSRLPRAASRRS